MAPRRERLPDLPLLAPIDDLYQFAPLATHLRRCVRFATPVQVFDLTRLYDANHHRNIERYKSRLPSFGITSFGLADRGQWPERRSV